MIYVIVYYALAGWTDVPCACVRKDVADRLYLNDDRYRLVVVRPPRQ